MTLVIRHGAVRRGTRTVLQAARISLEMPAALALIGINGCGKSSLFMQLTDTLSTRGCAAVMIDGRQASLACVPQVPALPGWLRTDALAAMYGLRFESLVERMPGLYLSEVAGQKASTLSTGQRQALAIALAIGRCADVTLLDEPFSALDFRRRLGTLELLRNHRREGRAIVLSSQSATDLIELCDRFIVIREGRYVFDGRRQDLATDGGDREVEQRLLRILTTPVPAMEVPPQRH